MKLVKTLNPSTDNTLYQVHQASDGTLYYADKELLTATGDFLSSPEVGTLLSTIEERKLYNSLLTQKQTYKALAWIYSLRQAKPKIIDTCNIELCLDSALTDDETIPLAGDAISAQLEQATKSLESEPPTLQPINMSATPITPTAPEQPTTPESLSVGQTPSEEPIFKPIDSIPEIPSVPEDTTHTESPMPDSETTPILGVTPTESAPELNSTPDIKVMDSSQSFRPLELKDIPTLPNQVRSIVADILASGIPLTIEKDELNLDIRLTLHQDGGAE